VQCEQSKLFLFLLCLFGDVKQNPEKWFYIFGKKNLNLCLFSFSSRKLHKNYQLSGKINSNICLMLSVYKSFHHNYGQQRKHILQDLTGFEI